MGEGTLWRQHWNLEAWIEDYNVKKEHHSRPDFVLWTIWLSRIKHCPKGKEVIPLWTFCKLKDLPHNVNNSNTTQ